MSKLNGLACFNAQNHPFRRLTPANPKSIFVHKNIDKMKNTNIPDTVGFAGISAFFAGAFIIYLNFFQQMIHFILNLQLAGIHH